MYFILIGILQTIPEVSITREKPTILLPFIFIFILTAIKDLFEDYKRFKSDTKENNSNIFINEFYDFRFKKDKWRNLFSGEIVKIFNGDVIPADCVLIKSSDVKINGGYVETKNLDGETNLKKKDCVKIKKYVTDKELLTNIKKGRIEFEEENCNLEEFQGFLFLDNKKIELTEKNLLLRGCVLKNTKFVIAVVVYTGHKTKVMLNSVKAKGKKSSLDKKTGYFVYYTLILQICFCSFASFYYIIVLTIWKKEFEIWLQFQSSELFLIFLKKFGNWTLIFGNFIPISLLITLESIKFFQAIRMTLDKDMEIISTNSKGEKEIINCTVQNSSLNEELGQVNHVFTDKTGTLTENKMLFSGIILNSEKFCEDHFKIDNKFEEILKIDSEIGNLAKKALKCMGLCHSILFDEENRPNSPSSEEIAFYKYCKQYGYEFLGQHHNDENEVFNILEENGIKKKYKVLELIEFSSKRKKMSIIVEDEKKDVYMFTKGADDIIKDDLIKNINQEHLEELENGIEKAALEGFRVLMLAYKKITPQNFEKWNIKYKKIKKQYKNPENLKKKEKLEKEIEKDLELIGAGILEDKLQDKVKETIEFMLRANMKIWMITGDKTQTAISVGRNAGMITKHDKLIILDNPTKLSQKTIDELNELLQAYFVMFSVIVSGKFFTELIKIKTKKKNLYNFFLKILLKAQTVIFSRASPKQKQEIVKMVKDYDSDCITLAIGDGANDVNMITAADIGIGIKGSEGSQASRASDFHFGRFKFLLPLIFFYGRENYRKNSVVVLYMFYKNVMIVMPQFWFGFFNFFSGQTLYEAFSYQLYNVIETFLPIFLYGIFDRTLSKKQFLSNPKLYKVGPKNIYFNKKIYFSWICSAMFISFYICFSCLSIFDLGTTKNGHFFGLWNYGNMCLLAIILIVNLKLLAISNSYSILSIIFFVISILSFYVLWFLFSVWKSNDLYTTFWECVSYCEFYVFHFVVFGISIIEYYLEKIIAVIFTQKYKLVDQRPSMMIMKKRRMSQL